MLLAKKKIRSDQLDIEIKNLITNETVSILEINKSPDIKIADVSEVKSKITKHEEYKDLFFNHENEIKYEIKHSSKLIIKKGDYKIFQDLIIPHHLSLVLDEGVTLRLGEGVALICKNDVYVNGSKELPVEILPLNEDKPFGSLVIIGNKDNETIINHLNLVGGSEKWHEGAFFSGGLSIHYHGKVKIMNSTFNANKADDGINLKYIDQIIISSSSFLNNAVDQVDIDNSNAIITDSKF